MTDPQPKHELTAKYGRCPVCGMALWPDGTCTLPLHTAKRVSEPPLADVIPIQSNPKPEVEIVSSNESVPTLQEQILNTPPLIASGADGEVIQLSLFGAMAARYRVASTEIKFGGSVEQISDTLRKLTGRDIEPGDTLDLTIRVDVGAVTTTCKDDVYSTAMKLVVTHLFDAKVQQSAEDKMRARIEATKRLAREIREREEREASRRDFAVVGND